MEGSQGPGGQIAADSGHWLLDPTLGVLRRVEAIDGRSARLLVYRCETQDR